MPENISWFYLEINLTPKQHKILIGIPLASSVSAEFFRSFLSVVNLMPEEGQCVVHTTKWQNIVKARNNIVEEVLKHNFTHLFFMDSDMTFPENALSRLMQHDKDIVGGLYTTKVPPFNTTAFKGGVNGSKEPWTSFTPTLEDGLVELDGIGTGCLLIRREVLESMSWPWFWYEESPDKPNTMMSEDIYFCLMAREMGFKMWCDTTILCGHVGEALVSPLFKEDKMQVSIDMV